MSVFIGYPSFMAYQMMKGKKDNNEGFPTIPGTIARYSALGLTNEEMSKNPVWVDKTGNGHDLQMKNFAWGGMSGVGGYEMNFNSWANNVPSISDISMSKTTSSVSVSVGNSAYNNNLIYIHKNNWDVNKNHWLKVASTYEDGDLAFIFYNDKYTKKIELPANGYANIPAYPEFKGSYMYISTTSNKQGSFTIEQLPLYPGALVFDGVDDYGTCNNFPVLTKEKGYTVVALRQWIEEKNDSTALVSNCKNWNQDGAFLFEYNNLRINFLNVAISFGHVSSVDRGKSPFSYQTSKLYNGKNIKPGSFIGSNELVVGKGNKDFPTVSNAAIWEIVILDHDATEEELTKIKDYFVKTYPWLFPDQAWTVVGKTNEDEDRATIANITGNGNNLVLSNFGFAEGSGYNEEGEYAGYLVTDGVDDEIISAKLIQFADKFTIVGDWKFMEDRNDNAGLLKANQIYIYNATTGMRIYLKQGSKNYPFSCKKINALTSDGWVYDEKWDKYKVYPIGSDIDISSRLFLGFYSSNFTKIALKNLGIYNNQILSKDDCIKAYNYLQTLKAK